MRGILRNIWIRLSRRHSFNEDYINRLSRGSSIIKVPKLSCSEEQITMDIMCNTVATGSFICDATDKVYGMVYADNERVKILSEQFGGTHIITEYQVDASDLKKMMKEHLQ